MNASTRTPRKDDQTILKGFQNIGVKIRSLVFNSELIEFCDSTIKKLDSCNEKIVTLLYLKKLVIQTPRHPDPDHYRAFEDAYIQEAVDYDPIAWIEAEIEFYAKLQQLDLNKSAVSSVVADAKLKLSATWLTHQEVQEMFKISRTTLNRRIAEGMPNHKKGKFVFFDIDEVSAWIKEEVSK